MKQLLTVLLIFMVLQLPLAQKINYGVKGGLNMASIVENYDTPIEKKYKLGFQFGGFVKISLSEKLYIQPELLYSLQGTKFGKIDLTKVVLPQTNLDDLFAHYNKNSKQNESNIILPIMLRYYFSEKVFAELGPQLDFLFYTNADGFRIKNNGQINYNDSSNESDFNFGLNFGVGYNLNEKFGLNLRYHYGFNRLEKRGALVPYDRGESSRNSVFSLNLEYRFVK